MTDPRSGRTVALVAVSAVAVVIAAVLLFAGIRHVLAGRRTITSASLRTDPAQLANTGGSAPAVAVATVRELTSGADAAAQRAAVTPELAALLPTGRLFPAGTSFIPQPDSWARTGAYAHLTGTLREPGAAATSVEVGLVLRGAKWMVTFEEQR